MTAVLFPLSKLGQLSVVTSSSPAAGSSSGSYVGSPQQRGLMSPAEAQDSGVKISLTETKDSG